MKTAISLPDPLFEAADELAARLGVSRSELFRRALEKLLQDHDEQRVTEALNEVYAAESSAIPSALALMQSASLSDDW